MGKKFRRKPFIAANGILILVPSALFLSDKAVSGALDAMVCAVQALESLAGAVNRTLVAMNMRDGLRPFGRVGRRASP